MQKLMEEAPLCACGCGEKVGKSTVYRNRNEWNKFISGHNARTKERQKEKQRRISEPQPTCLCGCGELVKRNSYTLKWNKFVRGHANKGKKLTKRVTEASQKALENLIQWNKNRVWTEEMRKNISDKNKGKKLTKETRRKMSKAKKGIKKSEETKKRMSLAQMGNNVGEEARKKIAISKMRCRTPKTGYSDDYSSIEYRNDLRKGHCEICGVTNMLHLKICGMRLATHHKDFNKLNSHPNNIQTLCNKCHLAIHREKWKRERGKING